MRHSGGARVAGRAGTNVLQHKGGYTGARGRGTTTAVRLQSLAQLHQRPAASCVVAKLHVLLHKCYCVSVGWSFANMRS